MCLKCAARGRRSGCIDCLLARPISLKIKAKVEARKITAAFAGTGDVAFVKTAPQGYFNVDAIEKLKTQLAHYEMGRSPSAVLAEAHTAAKADGGDQ